MTIESVQVSVSTVAVSLASGGSKNGIRVSVYNAGSPSVYLGGSTVSGTTGHLLASSATAAFYVDAEEALYAIAGSGTATVHVLKGGVDA